MAKNDAVVYQDYTIYPLALYLTQEQKWQPIVLITRDTSDLNLTLPRSQSFPQLPGMFEEEGAALDYALQYGRMLIDGTQQGLHI